MTADFSHVRFISAGAGSGKTYRLTEELERALVVEGIEPRRIMGTTFTVKAAGELRERVRERLIGAGQPELAEQTALALVGTVHSVCERLLKRFAFELGLSPELNVASFEDCAALCHQALDEASSAAAVREMNGIAARLGANDWRSDVKLLVDRARDNDVSPQELSAMGTRNADELLAHFPEPREGDWDARLLAAVRDALDDIDLTVDTTAGTAKYVALLRGCAYQLRRPPCPWPVWITLSKEFARKKSDAIAARVRAAAAAYECHPRFRADIRAYVENVFRLAGDTMERFQLIKGARGLIDFPDMEQLTLRALREPAVRQRLAAELDLLLVDEFQDTNPMQLAIFMELCQLVRKAIFVGDVKQAIYAFRGCDPDLVFSMLEALRARGGETEVLEYSWRARPALVSYINAVFTQAFADEIPADHVRLSPQRCEQSGEAAVLCWTMEGDKAARAEHLARAVVGLVRSGYRVVDRDTKQPRPVRWGDIAVLAATNDNVESVARALRTAHVPMKMTLKGLFTVPEVCLARACLRRLNDPSDTLATAEIVSLSECSDPESWLPDRMRWLAQGGDGFAWAEGSHPMVRLLAALREQIRTQSPVEIVARVLNYVGIREAVTAWGPDAIKAAQRQRNLDALLTLAVEYERHCDAQHLAATLTGLLFWLENPHSPELDLQPVITTGDAVHVLTYHKAKGLEWPVVIATDPDYRWQSRLWDVRVTSDGAFDLMNPLADRVIRLWPRVFGDHSSGVPVLERLNASDEGVDCVSRNEAEQRRLAYVGLTRARDALVLALPTKAIQKQSWMHAFAGDFLLPRDGELALPDGESVPVREMRLEHGAQADPPRFDPRRLPQRPPLAGAAREIVTPSRLPARDIAGEPETVRLGERLRIYGNDMTAIGNVLHAVIAAELINGDLPDAAARARALLAGHGVEAFLDADAALDAARRLRAWIERRFDPLCMLVEHPVTHRLEDRRVVRGWIDVLLETRAGWIVIDHKSSPRPSAEWAQELAVHSGQLAAYAAALAAAGKPVAGCWLHFPVGGGAIGTSALGRLAEDRG